MAAGCLSWRAASHRRLYSGIIPTVKSIELTDNRRCFACGPDNPIGLHLDFRLEDGRAKALFVPLPDHQGYAGITHGGILATVLDEAMARVLWDQGAPVLTGNFSMRLRKPAEAGVTLLVEAWVESERACFVNCQAHLKDPDGNVMAEASGVYVRIPRQQE